MPSSDASIQSTCTYMEFWATVCAYMFFFNDKSFPAKGFSSSTPILCLENNSVRAHFVVNSDLWEHVFVVRSCTWHSRVYMCSHIPETIALYPPTLELFILNALCASPGLKTCAGRAVEIDIYFPPDSLPVVSTQLQMWRTCLVILSEYSKLVEFMKKIFEFVALYLCMASYRVMADWGDLVSVRREVWLTIAPHHNSF